MRDYKERVIAEKKELDAKLQRLSVFLDGDSLKTLPQAEQERMQRQLVIMKDYSMVLEERIAAF